MTAEEIVNELRSLGREGTKRVLLRHGIAEPVLGVLVADLKTIQKRIRKDHELALKLYDTGIYEAQYLAGLICDDSKMTKSDLQRWARNAKSMALCGSIVAWVAAESPHGWELALKWKSSPKEAIAVLGWSTLCSYVSITPDETLDLNSLKSFLKEATLSIHQAPNRVRHAMNQFVICVGCYIKPLLAEALETANAIGKITVDVGDTDCQVPLATAYIQKVIDRGTVGKKRKTAKC